MHLNRHLSSTGLSVQAGFDYALSKDLTLNVDIKKIKLRTDVKSGATTVTELTLDPPSSRGPAPGRQTFL